MTFLKHGSIAVFVVIVAVGMTACAASRHSETMADPPKETKFRKLVEMLGAPDAGSDFEAMTEFENDFEATCHEACIDYLNANPQMVQKIRDDLGCQGVHWQLKGMSHRILYIPEEWEEGGKLYVEYCQEAISDLLEKTGLANPYNTISIQAVPKVDDASGDGVDAIIVRDLAREYKVRYQFGGDSEKTVELDLSGRMPLNEVGSYASYLEYFPEERRWRFSRDQQTIWKCTSRNPYTVLMTPIEETLHIVLREYTEGAILKALERSQTPPSTSEVEVTVEEWLAVEEAVVGGLVYKLAPEVILDRVPGLSPALIREDIETKKQYRKYRLLQNGIDWVECQGVKRSIELYRQDPDFVQTQLIEGTC